MFPVGLKADIAEKNRILTEDFTKLYLEFDNEGLFEPSYWHIFVRIVEVLVLGFAGYSLLCCQNFVAKCVGTIILGFAQGRCGWIQHETGHHSWTGNPRLDRFLQVIFVGKHHHSSSLTQTVQFVRFNLKFVRKSSAPRLIAPNKQKKMRFN